VSLSFFVFFARILRVAEAFAGLARNARRSVTQSVFRSGSLHVDLDLPVFGAEVIQPGEGTNRVGV